MIEIDSPIRREKADFANHAVKTFKLRKIADLGGCWGVNAGYTLDLVANNDIEEAYVIDQRVTELSRQRARSRENVKFVQGWFDRQETADQIPSVDGIIMFDVLLHQVNPDWTKVLELWSKKTTHFIIYNQMWMKDNATVRFIERGLEWYKENVYFTNEAKLETWFKSHGKIDAASGKLQEERHAFWQWGIAPPDLIKHMDTLGFSLAFRENHGRFPPAKQAWIQNEAYIFSRKLAK